MKKTNTNQNRSKGVIAAEFALMVPILLITFLGAVDLALILREHQVLQNAAREGARYSSLPKNNISPNNPTASEAQIKQKVIDYCSWENIALAAGDITIDQNETITVGGTTIGASRVTLTTTRAFLTPGATLIFNGPVTLTAIGIFRNLY